jgi:hypothetical protein
MATYFLDSSAIIKRYVADDNLIEIAIAEGLSVENPNNYP